MEEYKQNVLIKLSYDGTSFNGWQVQKKKGQLLGGSVQECVEKALRTLHKCDVKTVAAGRTDSGVHAREQAVSFYTNLQSISEKSWPLAINAFLPHTVRVIRAHFMKDSFNARFNALSRTYRYFILNSGALYPYYAPYCLSVSRRPSLESLNSLAASLCGEKDFSFFAYARDQSISKSRYVMAAHFFIEGQFLVFEITATSFLWRMVRSIVGTLLEYERKGWTASQLILAMKAKDKTKRGATAPSHPLFLWHVEYPKDMFISNEERA